MDEEIKEEGPGQWDHLLGSEADSEMRERLRAELVMMESNPSNGGAPKLPTDTTDLGSPKMATETNRKSLPAPPPVPDTVVAQSASLVQSMPTQQTGNQGKNMRRSSSVYVKLPEPTMVVEELNGANETDVHHKFEFDLANGETIKRFLSVVARYDRTVDNVVYLNAQTKQIDEEEVTVEKIVLRPSGRVEESSCQCVCESQNSVESSAAVFLACPKTRKEVQIYACHRGKRCKPDQSSLESLSEPGHGSGSIWDQCQLTFTWRYVDDWASNTGGFQNETSENVSRLLDFLSGCVPEEMKRDLPVAMSNDGMVLAQVNSIGNIDIKLCLLPDELRTIENIGGDVYSLNFSHDGVMLAGCGRFSNGASSVKVWSAVTGALIREFEPEGAEFEVLASFSADNAFLVSIVLVDKRLQLRMRSITQGVVLEELPDPLEAQRINLRALPRIHSLPVDAKAGCCGPAADKAWADFRKTQLPPGQAQFRPGVSAAALCETGGKRTGSIVDSSGAVHHVRGEDRLEFNLLFPFVYASTYGLAARVGLAGRAGGVTHESLRSQRAASVELDERCSKHNLKLGNASIFPVESLSLCSQGRILASVYQHRRSADVRNRAANGPLVYTKAELESEGLEVDGARIRVKQPGQSAQSHPLKGVNVAVVPDNTSVVIWDVWRGEVVHVFEHPQPVNGASVSPDGGLLTVAMSGKDGRGEDMSESAVLIYSLVTFQRLWHSHIPWEVAFAQLQLPKEDEEIWWPGSGSSGPDDKYAAEEKGLRDDKYYAEEEKGRDFLLRERVKLKRTDAASEDAAGLILCKASDAEAGDDAATNLKYRVLYIQDDTTLFEAEELPKRMPGEDTEKDSLQHLCVSDDRRVAVFVGKSSSGSSFASFPTRPASGSSLPESATRSRPRPYLALVNDVGDRPGKGKGKGKGGSKGTDTGGAIMRLPLGSIQLKKLEGQTQPSASEARAQWLKHENNPSTEGAPPPPRSVGRRASVNEDGSEPISVKALAMSANGELIGMCYKGGGGAPGERKGVWATVMSRKSLHRWETHWVAELPFQANESVKGMCITGKRITVISDKPTQDGIESRIVNMNIFTHRTVITVRMVRGHTLGIAMDGKLRVALLEAKRRIIVEEVQSGEVQMEFDEGKDRFLGVSSSGSLLVFAEPPARAGLKGRIKLRDLRNIRAFGPSAAMLEHWAKDDDAVEILEPQQNTLAVWPLIWRSRWADAVSGIFDRAIETRNLSVLKLLVDACPAIWAAVPYRTEKPRDEQPPAFCDSCLAPKNAAKRKLPPPRSLLQACVSKNEKMLLQIFLDAIVASVSDHPETVPVVQMEQITELIRLGLREKKMLDKWDAFLKDLPLIKVSIPDGVEKIVTSFGSGEVFASAWWCHHSFTSSSPWTFLKLQKDPSSGAGGEVGYRYVVALPDLAHPDTLHDFTELTVDAALIDNESMRVTIDALERTLWSWRVTLPGIGNVGLDLWLLCYVLCLAAYFLFVYYATTEVGTFPDLPDVNRERLLDTAEGTLGIVAGAVAVFFNAIFLVLEGLEFFTSKTALDWLAGGFWNILPVLLHIFSIVSYIVVLTDQGRTSVRILSSLVTVLLWINLFNFLRAYRRGSALVTLLLQIMFDMIYFVGVVAVLVFAFACGWFALHGKLTPETLYGATLSDEQAEFIEDNDGANGFLYNTFNQALSRTFVATVLGGFELEEYRSPVELGDTGPLTAISYLFFFSAAILVLVVAMNALIALMGATYSRVAESERAWMYKEIAAVLYDKSRLGQLTAGARNNFIRLNRWTHLLSPSETGSRPVELGKKKEADEVLKSGLNEVVQTTKELQMGVDGLKTQLEQQQEPLRNVSSEVEGLKNQQAEEAQHAEDRALDLTERVDAWILTDKQEMGAIRRALAALRAEHEDFKRAMHNGMTVVHDGVRHVRAEVRELPERVGPPQVVRTIAVPSAPDGDDGDQLEVDLSGGRQGRRRLWS